jgi:putative tryptophan/tyrosine transport system substrate-binding protein
MRANSIGRRDVLALFAGAAAALPQAGFAQTATISAVGYLGAESPERMALRLRAFRQGLVDTGYTEGSNLTVEYRWAEGRNDRLPALAADLIRHDVAVLAAPGSLAAALAGKAATATIPVVFETGADPGRPGTGRQSEPAGRQRHGRHLP